MIEPMLLELQPIELQSIKLQPIKLQPITLQPIEPQPSPALNLVRWNPTLNPPRLNQPRHHEAATAGHLQSWSLHPLGRSAWMSGSRRAELDPIRPTLVCWRRARRGERVTAW